jgi:hypothetical protein
MLQRITIRITTRKIRFATDITDTVVVETNDWNNYGANLNTRASK